jgi:phage tail-like protein
MSSVTRIPERLLAQLPAIYREDAFLARYLWAFEQVLVGLEQQIDRIAELFDPAVARADFLPWLSSWVGFTLRADLTVEQQRAFLARVIPLYRRRGTRQNLQELLSIFTRGIPTVTEPESPTHYFRVTIRLPAAAPEVQLRQSAIARALIEMEKPAHTHYDLDVVFPTMQIAQTSTIGVDTLLGVGRDGS